MAISSHLFWGLTNVFEKIIIDKKIKNPLVYIAYAFLFSWLGVFLIPFVDFQIYSFVMMTLIAIASLSFFVGSIFYIKALKLEEVSRINLLWNLIPIFTFTGAWIFIGEKLFINQILAFIFLVLGGFVGSLHAKSFSKFKFSKAFVVMLVACVFFAIYGLITRYLTLQGCDFFVISIWGPCFLTLWAVIWLLNKNFRKEFLKEKKLLFSKNFFLFVLFLAFLSKFGMILNTWAISLGPISLVNAMEGFQALFVFIIATLLTLFLPKIMKEELDKKNLFLKFAALVLMIGGLVVLSL